MREIEVFAHTDTHAWSAPHADDVLFAAAMERMLLQDCVDNGHSFGNVCYFAEGAKSIASTGGRTALHTFVRWS